MPWLGKITRIFICPLTIIVKVYGWFSWEFCLIREMYKLLKTSVLQQIPFTKYDSLGVISWWEGLQSLDLTWIEKLISKKSPYSVTRKTYRSGYLSCSKSSWIPRGHVKYLSFNSGCLDKRASPPISGKGRELCCMAVNVFFPGYRLRR